jgi:hypothetical protein
MQTEIKKQRGGYRPGAGRKGTLGATKPVNTQIPLADLEAIEELGGSLSDFIRSAVKEKLVRDKGLSS